MRHHDGRSAVEVTQPRLSLGDLLARTQITIAGAAADPWALALRLDLRAPIGLRSEGGGSSGWDVGAGVAVTAELAPWLVVHAMATVSTLSRFPRAFPLQPNRVQGGVQASVVFIVGQWRFLSEDRLVSSLFEGDWQVVQDDGRAPRSSAAFGAFFPQNQVALGVRFGAWTLWLAEDVTPGTAYETPGSFAYCRTPRTSPSA